MLHIDITLEDTRLIATHNGPDNWEVIMTDLPTGKQGVGQMTDLELHAMIALAVHPDGMPIGTAEYYAIAEPALERCGFDRELRFIP